VVFYGADDETTTGTTMTDPQQTKTILPGLDPLPVIGARLDLIRFLASPLKQMQRIYTECGSIGALTRGSSSLIVAASPEFNRQILTQPDLFRNYAEPPLKFSEDSPLMTIRRSLTALNGEEHRRMRRLMRPTFSRQSVEGYCSEMVAVAQKHLRGWQPGETRDIADEMTRLTLSVMMQSIFGLGPTSEEFSLGNTMFELLKSMISVGIVVFPFNLPGTPYRRMYKLGTEVNARIGTLIERRKREGLGGHDILSSMIRAQDDDGSQMDHDQLVAQASMLFAAGHETTASTLSWALFLLACHPDIYENLVAEIDEVLDGEAPTIGHLAQLSVLDAVVKETMRLLPAVPALFFRRLAAETQLNGYSLPAGSHLLLSPYLTHRIPELYPNPACFKPNRWTSIKPTPYEYMPFGAGPRLCLGAAFSSQEIRLILATLVQRFRLELPADTAVSHQMSGIILSPQTLEMKVLDQDRRFPTPPSVRGTITQLMHLPAP